MPTLIAFDDLEHALLWVSSPPEFEAKAFISRSTGKVYSRNVDGPIEDDYPDDIDDGVEYVAVPGKNALDLGRALAFAFAEEQAPQLVQEVHHAFSRKGAYGRFKSLLQRHRLIERWHEYENEATAVALRRWAEEQGFQVAGGPHDA